MSFADKSDLNNTVLPGLKKPSVKFTFMWKTSYGIRLSTVSITLAFMQ